MPTTSTDGLPPPGANLPAAVAAIAAQRQPVELWHLAMLLGCYALVYGLQVLELYRPLNLGGPLALLGILGLSCYRMLRRSPITVWAPLFWFRAASATYFGFGALVPHFVNDETRQYIFALHYFDEALNLKVNLIYCLGIFCTLVCAHFFLRGGARPSVPDRTVGGRLRVSRTLSFAVGFLLVGGVLRYGLVLPYALGLPQFFVAGSLLTLAKVYYVGIYLLIVHVVGTDRRFLLPALVLIGFEIAVAISTFAKFDLLLILVFSFMGFISYEATRRRIILGSAVVLFAYFAFQPLVEYGRDQLVERYGEIRGAGLEERWQIVQAYLSGGAATTGSTMQGGLSRLSYVNVDAFVVDRYDLGVPGDTFRDVMATLVPRILWSDKPNITQLGSDLNYAAYGRDTSALGVGYFAEPYWNFGWLGIPPLMAVLALILSIFTRASMAIMAHRDWLFLPVVFIGVNMGLRVDGFLVPDVLGPAWMAFLLGVGLFVMKNLVSVVTARRSAPPGRAAPYKRHR